MKKLLSILTLLIFSTIFAFASDAFYKKGKAGSIKVEISSEKPLVVGDNEIILKLSKKDTSFKDAKIKFKVFMPEMPGMPYMEYIDKPSFENGLFKNSINFSMGGTWQIHIFIELDGKKYRYKGSVIL